jgi:signal transduction histidine kinase
MCKLEAGRLEDALMKLCLNSRDATPGGGSVRITLRIEQPAQTVASSMAAIMVSDTGQGMTPEVLARALDRNFTTKPEGQGSGLGLASVKEFVESAGGSITLESKPGYGTRVVLRLPVA